MAFFLSFVCYVVAQKLNFHFNIDHRAPNICRSHKRNMKQRFLLVKKIVLKSFVVSSYHMAEKYLLLGGSSRYPIIVSLA